MIHYIRKSVISAAAIVATTTVLVAGTAYAGSSNDSHGRVQDAPLDHIYVLMLENHSQSSVIGDANAPYITGLANQYGVADHYYGVTHPSMPNYLAAISGQTFGIQDDNDQNLLNLDRINLVDQLESRHLTWDAYMETLPANKLDRFGPVDASGNQISLYAKKHNPFVLFDDIANNPTRMSHIKDYSSLDGDLNALHPANFVWITPNQCNDMHGGVYVTVPGHPETPCPYGSAKDDANDAALKQKADQFVHTTVETIMHSRAWSARSAIVVLTDENDFTGNTETGGWESADGCCNSPYVPKGDTRVSASWPGGTYGGGLIPAIVITGAGPHHVVSHTPYNHYSLLATIETNWHLGYLGFAGDQEEGVVPMWDLMRPND